MTDLDTALFQAWARVAPKLLADPEEVQRRLARRQSKLFARPLRAFCLSVRASDRRISDTYALIEPRTAIDPRYTGRCEEHTVTLDQRLLQLICQSVKIATPGEPADHIADKLGTTRRTVFTLRRRGLLSTDLKPGLMGRRGKPVPLVYSPEYLDSQACLRTGADEIFARCWRRNPQRIPDGFTQTITRIPSYRRHHGRDHFVGWYWICPCCRRSAQVLHHPLDQPDFPTLMDFAPALSAPLPRPNPVFACGGCHRVIGFSRSGLVDRWNTLILRITGGLMYGREVQRPEWLKEQRTRPFRPRPARPAPSRDRTQRLLAETSLTCAQIAAKTGASLSAVRKHTRVIYKRHHVHTRQDLQRLLRPPQPLAPAARAG